MDNIKQWAITLCIICIASGVLRFLLPDGTVKKCAEVAFAVLLILSIISILNNDVFSDINIDYSEDVILPYSNGLNTYVEDMAEDEVVNIIKNSLDTVCNTDYHIDVSWENYNSTYQLTTISVTVYPEDENSIDEIKSTVGSLTGVIPEVKILYEY